MTPEQLREAYRATHLRRLQIDQEEEALEAIDGALDAYARLVGYDLAAIVDPIIEQPDPNPAGAGLNGAGVDSGPVEAPAPSAPATCPECGKVAVSEQGLAVHRARAHKISGKTKPGASSTGSRGQAPPLIGKAATQPKPILRNGRETFLCNRCSETFPSKDALTGHLMKGHGPSPRGKPVIEQPVAEYGRHGDL